MIPSASGYGQVMQIDKQQIIEFLEARGDKERVAQAEHELPDPVDTEEYQEQIALLGIDLEDLTGGLGGPGGIGERQTSNREEG